MASTCCASASRARCHERGGLGGAAEVHERDRAVVERVGRARAALRLPPRVRSPGGLLPGRPQDRGHLGEVVGAVLRPLPEAAGQEVGDGLGHREPAAGGVPPGRGQDLGGGETVLPRAPAEERLEHRQAEAPQVRPAVERLARGLLGREVGRRSAAAALDRHRVPPGPRDRRLDTRRPGAGEAEVGDLGEPVRGEHHVRRLHVAVDEALLVRVVEPPRELDGDVEDGLDGVEAPRADGVVEAPAVHVLREDEREPVHPAHVVTGDDVGVQAEVDPGLRLALEELGAAGGLEDRGEGGLDGEVEAPAAVTDAVHAAHAALAEDARHLVEAEDHVARLPRHAMAGRQGRRRGLLGAGRGDGAVLRDGRRHGLGLGDGRRVGLRFRDRRCRLVRVGPRQSGGGHREARGAAGAADRPTGEMGRHLVGGRAAGRAADRQEGGTGHRPTALPAARTRTPGPSGTAATARRRAPGR